MIVVLPTPPLRFAVEMIAARRIVKGRNCTEWPLGELSQSFPSNWAILSSCSEYLWAAFWTRRRVFFSRLSFTRRSRFSVFTRSQTEESSPI